MPTTDHDIQAEADRLLDLYLAERVEDEGTDDEDDRQRAEAARWDKYAGLPIVGLLLAACVGLLLPCQPTPIDDSLPSGLHDAGRATNPAPVTDGWRGFLWTT